MQSVSDSSDPASPGCLGGAALGVIVLLRLLAPWSAGQAKADLLTNAPHDTLNITKDLRVGEAKDAPPELGKPPIPPSVMTLAVLMRGAIHLDDEAKPRTGKVDNEGGDDELPAKPEAEARALEVLPESKFGSGRVEAHTASELLEASGASDRDSSASKHGDLPEARTRERVGRSLWRSRRDARGELKLSEEPSAEPVRSEEPRGAGSAPRESPTRSRVRAERRRVSARCG